MGSGPWAGIWSALVYGESQKTGLFAQIVIMFQWDLLGLQYKYALWFFFYVLEQAVAVLEKWEAFPLPDRDSGGGQPHAVQS